MLDIFLSYCRKDAETADNIYGYFKDSQDIELHRDTIDIGKWASIKEYMQSIQHMDYAILIISDSYLKSSNCMYEVLEVMRDRKYRNKIFPAVIEKNIYNPISKAGYVKYWEAEFEKLKEAIQGIGLQNLGDLHKDLKRLQDISSNIAEFLGVVSDMNNPDIEDVSKRIEEKLKQKGFIVNSAARISGAGYEDLHARLRGNFKEVRERDRAGISQEAELLARKLWDDYRDGIGGIYLLELARIRKDKSEMENLYYELIGSADLRVSEAAKRWNEKWRCVNELL